MAYSKTNVNHPIPMNMQANPHVARLLDKHAALESALAEQTSGVVTDWDGVKLIKKRKLEIADELERFLGRRN